MSNEDTRSPLAPSASVAEAKSPSKFSGYGPDRDLDKSVQSKKFWKAPETSQERDPVIRRELSSVLEGRADGGKGSTAGFARELPKS